MKIAIMGAGAFGTALGGILAEKGWDIDYYDSEIEHEKLSDVIEGAKYLVLAVPSLAVSHLLPHLPKNIPLIVATKGILGARAFDDFADFMVLSGPGFAADIKAHQKTHLTATDRRVVELFATDYLDFDFTEDENGVLMCGALKNVYAIGAGVRNLKPQTPEWNQYITEVAEELRALLSANNADSDTVDLNCGIGDLKLTCNLPSRNYEFGQILRENSKALPEKTVEGISTIKRILAGEIKVPETAVILKEILRLWN